MIDLIDFFKKCVKLKIELELKTSDRLHYRFYIFYSDSVLQTSRKDNRKKNIRCNISSRNGSVLTLRERQA